MRTTIDSYKTRAGRLDLDGIDFAAFADRPLSPSGLRCLRYMHDIEHHTVCYMRDLLLTPAHRDPDVTAFLSCWVYEELFHGEALAQVLESHGIPAGAPRVADLRERRKWKDAGGLALHLGASALAGRTFIALHMAWGAVNEWTTQAAYARLAALEDHPVLRELLTRIMRQEGRHIDFYAAEATRRLAASRGARALTRTALGRFWRPVGSGVMPEVEVAFLSDYLFSGPDGRAVAERIDRRVDQLPGLGHLQLVDRALDQLARVATTPVEDPSRGWAQPAARTSAKMAMA
jgi:hypothetical protein